MRRPAGFFAAVPLLVLTVLAPAAVYDPFPAQAGPAAQQGPPCELLDDPSIRGRMSGAFELALLEACGRFTPGPEQPVPPPIPAGVEQGGPDVRVNAVDPVAYSTVQSETSIAVNETTGAICSGYNDSYHFHVQGLGYCGFSRSVDGGLTWEDGGVLPPGGGGRSRGDPSVVWRQADGFFYYTCIHMEDGSGDFRLGLWRSTDDCATFQWVGLAHDGYSDDKELMGVDNHPGSPYYGRFYIVWTDYGAGGQIRLIHSDDGLTWSSPVDLSDSWADVQGAWPAVAPNGDVYVAWVRWNPYPSGPIDIEGVRSTNGGVSWTALANPLAGAVNPRDQAATSNCGRPALRANAGDGIRYLPSPQIVVGPDGCLHVVYSYDPDGYGVGDVVDVYYRRSCNQGASWGPEIRLNDDLTLTDQFFPAVAVNESNIVSASWYDRRLDPAGNYFFDRYVALSEDGGVTWGASERVSDVSSPVYISPYTSSCYHGDYDQLAMDTASVLLQWSDDRVFFNGHYDPDVWFDRWWLACEPVEMADFAWDPSVPMAGFPLTLTAAATGTLPISYTWELGDGTAAGGQLVHHRYELPGSYTVTLTATNCASATAVAVHTITVVPCEAVHEVDFLWQPLTPTAGQVVSFTAMASGTPAISYTWDLGDGTAAGGAAITHSYGLPGVYGVILTATNCGTATATAVHTVTVAAPCVPVQILSTTAEIVGCEVTFGAEVTGTSPFSWLWSFGDEMTATVEAPSHAYAATGSYTVTLQVGNCAGQGDDTEVIVLEVVCPTPVRIYLPLVVKGG